MKMSTYQEQYRQFAVTMGQLAQELAGDWTVNATDADGNFCWHATFTRADGLALNARLESGKARFSPRVPPAAGNKMQSLRDVLPYDMRDKASIEACVSLTRPLATIARDVVRRVVEPYAAVYSYVTEHQQRDLASVDELARMVSTIEATFPGSSKRQDARVTDSSVDIYMGAHSHAYRATVHRGGYVTVDVRSIPFEVAMRVLAAMTKELCP
jgi:hypothetical protein